MEREKEKREREEREERLSPLKRFNTHTHIHCETPLFMGEADRLNSVN